MDITELHQETFNQPLWHALSYDNRINQNQPSWTNIYNKLRITNYKISSTPTNYQQLQTQTDNKDKKWGRKWTSNAYDEYWRSLMLQQTTTGDDWQWYKLWMTNDDNRWPKESDWGKQTHKMTGSYSMISSATKLRRNNQQWDKIIPYMSLRIVPVLRKHSALVVVVCSILHAGTWYLRTVWRDGSVSARLGGERHKKYTW